VWLAFRSSHPTWWNNLGTVWSEYVTSYTGGAWTSAAYLNHSDAVLDNRPALASAKPGSLMMIGSSDGRREFETLRGRGARARGNVVEDPYNFDLYVHTLTLGPAAQKAELSAAQPAAAGAMADSPEQRHITAIRAARVNASAPASRGRAHAPPWRRDHAQRP
jgi:hypothetical protein